MTKEEYEEVLGRGRVVKPSVLGQKVRYVLEYTIEGKVVVGLVVSLDLTR